MLLWIVKLVLYEILRIICESVDSYKDFLLQEYINQIQGFYLKNIELLYVVYYKIVLVFFVIKYKFFIVRCFMIYIKDMYF